MSNLHELVAADFVVEEAGRASRHGLTHMASLFVGFCMGFATLMAALVIVGLAQVH